jgi:antitoxin component of RelBE/YafQ-DinJ toxin-antitoxin module
MIYYSTVHNIAVPRLIRNKLLPINLTVMTEKMNKNFRTSILEESRRILTD